MQEYSANMCVNEAEPIQATQNKQLIYIAKFGEKLVIRKKSFSLHHSGATNKLNIYQLISIYAELEFSTIVIFKSFIS